MIRDGGLGSLAPRLEQLRPFVLVAWALLMTAGVAVTPRAYGSLVTEFIEADVMQRDHNNPLMNAVMTRARERRYGTVLGASDRAD